MAISIEENYRLRYPIVFLYFCLKKKIMKKLHIEIDCIVTDRTIEEL